MAKAKKVIETEEITLPEVYNEYPKLKEYNLADIGIEAMAEAYKGLVIKDKDDNQGYEAVKSAMIVVRSKRGEVEKKRKELKADSLEYGKVVDAEAKRIQALIEPIETRLKNEKQKIDDEIRRIEEEKARKEKELIDSRKNVLFNSGMLYNPSGSLYYKEFVITEMEITIMNDQEFNTFSEKVIAQIEADEEAKQIEEQKQADERKRLLEEAEKLEKQRKEQEEAQAKIDEANRKIKEENDRIQKEKDMAEFKIKAQKEAKDNAEKQAKADADERLRIAKEKADAEIKRIKDEAEKKETDRLEKIRIDEERIAKEKAEAELALDKEKILKYVESLKLIPKPEIKPTKFKTADQMKEVRKMVGGMGGDSAGITPDMIELSTVIMALDLITQTYGFNVNSFVAALVVVVNESNLTDEIKVVCLAEELRRHKNIPGYDRNQIIAISTFYRNYCDAEMKVRRTDESK